MKFLFALVPLLAPLLAAAAAARSESVCPEHAPLAKCCRFTRTVFALGCVSPAPDITREKFIAHCREDHDGKWASCCEPPKDEEYPDDTLVCGLFNNYPGLQIQESAEGRDGL